MKKLLFFSFLISALAFTQESAQAQLFKKNKDKPPKEKKAKKSKKKKVFFKGFMKIIKPIFLQLELKKGQLLPKLAFIGRVGRVMTKKRNQSRFSKFRKLTLSGQ